MWGEFKNCGKYQVEGGLPTINHSNNIVAATEA